MDEIEIESVTDVKPSNLNAGNASNIQETNIGSSVSSNVFEELDFYYPMTGDKYMIIFNHFEYKKTRFFGDSHPPPRKGTHEDVKSLQRTFGDLGFKVQLHQDLEYESIIDEVMAVTKADHTATSCVIVAIMTHGSSGGGLTARDRPYQLSDVLTLFETGHQSLVAKPKLFFIQACRGDSMDSGRVVTDSHSEQTYVLPTHANFLVLYSTIEDYVSWRDIRGSWLIQELCATVAALSDRLDLLQIITTVNSRIAHERASYSTKRALSDKKQMPETRFTLTKLLRF